MSKKEQARLPDVGKIIRIPFEKAGVEDAVQTLVKSTVTEFKKKEDGAVCGINGQVITYTKMLASYQSGVVSFSVLGPEPFMLTVRLDELMGLIREAAIASAEATTNELVPKEGPEKKEEPAKSTEKKPTTKKKSGGTKK